MSWQRGGSRDSLHEMLAVISSKLQQWMIALQYTDPATKVECFCLISFTCSLLGSALDFPAAPTSF